MAAVLEYGWAYGNGGTALQGKDLVQAISTGGPDYAYREDGYNRYPMEDLLRPFERSATLCGLTYRPPYLFQGVRLKSQQEVERSEDRRVGKECGSRCRSRCSPYH